MQVHIFDTYGSLSLAAARQVIKSLSEVNEPLFCAASGDSPRGLYEYMTALLKKNDYSLKQWRFVGLDEWVGLAADDEGSCRYMLDRQIFTPLDIKQEQICFFNGRAKDLEAECNRTEAYIQAYGPIDMAVLGLGMNGHIGFNEPGTPANLRSHIANLDEITGQTGQKYFTTEHKLTQGITLGLANLLEAKELLLVVNGRQKAAIVKQALQGKINEQIPATLLRNHPKLTVYLDEAAVSLL